MESKVKDLSEMKSSTDTDDFGLTEISNTFQPGSSNRVLSILFSPNRAETITREWRLVEVARARPLRGM